MLVVGIEDDDHVEVGVPLPEGVDGWSERQHLWFRENTSKAKLDLMAMLDNLFSVTDAQD